MRHWIPPELEFQALVSCLTWVLGTKAGSSEEWYVLLIAEPFSSTLSYLYCYLRAATEHGPWT